MGTEIDNHPSAATVGGSPIPDEPDLARMRSERSLRLQRELEAQGLDGLVLLGSSAVAYATGAALPAQDGDRAALFRSVAVVVAGDRAPHLYTACPDGAPPELPDDHLHGPLFPDLDDGIEQFRSALAQHFPAAARIGVDDQTHAMLRGLSGMTWVDAGGVLAAAKLLKTPDELACIRRAQLVNELAMVDALKILRPGVRQTRPECGVPAPRVRTRRHRRRDRSDLAGDGAHPRTRAVDFARRSGLPDRHHRPIPAGG